MNRRKEIESKVMAFAMSNAMILEGLTQVEEKLGIDLGLGVQKGEAVKEIYYPQFSAHVRKEALEMREHYELFYCLEKTIRLLVAESIATIENSTEWWDGKRVPEVIREEVRTRAQKEIDSGFTRRSEEELDYTTFGELGQIITSNWDIFGGIFASKKAVEKVMASLNMLRGPIAHCSSLAEDEVLRLHLTVRDWFRLME